MKLYLVRSITSISSGGIVVMAQSESDAVGIVKNLIKTALGITEDYDDDNSDYLIVVDSYTE